MTKNSFQQTHNIQIHHACTPQTIKIHGDENKWEEKVNWQIGKQKTFPTHQFKQKKKWPEDAQQGETIVAQPTNLGKGSLSTIAYQSSLLEENIKVWLFRKILIYIISSSVYTKKNNNN